MSSATYSSGILEGTLLGLGLRLHKVDSSKFFGEWNGNRKGNENSLKIVSVGFLWFIYTYIKKERVLVNKLQCRPDNF